MKKIVTVVSICMFASNAFALQNAKDLFVPKERPYGTPITVEQAVNIALNNNTSINDAIKTRDIYRAQVKQYQASIYPSLSFTGSYTRNIEKQAFIMGGSKVEVGEDNVYSAGLDAKWILWSGGQVKNSVRIAKKQEQSSEYNLAAVRDLIELEVRKMCNLIVLANAVAKVQQGHLEIARQSLSEMQLKYKQGLSSNLDLLSQEVTVSNIEPLVIQAQNNFEVGSLNLKRFLNKDPEDDMYLFWEADMEFPEVKDLQEMYNLAAQYRPALAKARLAMEIAENDIKLTRAQHFPQLVAFANRYYNGQTAAGFPDEKSEYFWTSTAGLQVTMPIFEGFKVKSQVDQKKLAYEQAKQNFEDMQKDVRIGIKTAWLNLIEAKKRMSSGDTVIKQSRQNLESMAKRYRSGLASRLELDDATVALTNAQLQYVQAVHDAYNALQELRFTVGYEVRK